MIEHTAQDIERMFNRHDRALGRLARMACEITVEKVDTVFVFDGLGERERIAQGLHESQRTESGLYIAGSNVNEKTYKTPMDQLRDLGVEDFSNVTIKPEALHTKDQADWTAERIMSNEKNVFNMLAVAAYHWPRAFGTALDSLNKQALSDSDKLNSEHMIVPHFVQYSDEFIIPETRFSARDGVIEPRGVEDMVAAEAGRIKLYQQKGDVASTEEMEKHLTKVGKLL